MRNFQLIAREVNVVPLIQELQRNAELWDENTLRTKHANTAHSEVSDIWLWFNQIPKSESEIFKVRDDKDVIPYKAWKDLPSARALIFALMNQVQAVRLGRVIITRLASGKQITPHRDGGAPATYYQRYQFALQCLPGNVFNIGEESVSFTTGEVWHINNREIHSVINNSKDDRIVMIVDLRSE